jgi:hypothetical protein
MAPLGANTQRALERRITDANALDLNLSRSVHEADSSSLALLGMTRNERRMGVWASRLPVHI